MSARSKKKKKIVLNEEEFKQFPTYHAWKKIGFSPRFGVLTPLASIKSNRNHGIGDFADIPIFSKLLKEIGATIFQILPINDMGTGKVPYSAVSGFALDPVYISLEDIPEMKENRSPAVNDYIRENWHVVEEQKKARNINIDKLRSFKFGALYHLYRDFIDRHSAWNTQRWREFQSYIVNNRYWLDDYALFRVLKNMHNWASWKDWPPKYRNRRSEEVNRILRDNEDEIRFFKYVQWTAYEQMVGAHNWCREEEIFIKGDIPLLVDFDSADVWAHPEYFNLDVCAGAPPDQYSSMGQNWGTPTYNWDRLAQDNYIYWRKKLEYASHFYDIYRIDHIVGLFRIWSVPITEEHPRGIPAGWDGYFDPEDPGKGIHKPVWENHGRSLLEMMMESCVLLPIGEDLGTIPFACRNTMKNMGIPGYKVLIWEREWQKKGQPFIDPDQYEYLSMATTTTHDFWTMPGYWLYKEENPENEKEHQKNLKLLWKFIMGKEKFSEEYTGEFHRKLLKRLFESNSIFLIMPFADLWGKVPSLYGHDIEYDRINNPGKPDSENNWTNKMPVPVEEFADHPLLKEKVAFIRNLAKESGRVML